MVVLGPPDEVSMSQQSDRGPAARGDHFRNGVLTVIAVMLGLLVLGQLGQSPGGGGGPSEARAQAQPEALNSPEGGLISAADQRKTIIAELRSLSRKVEQLDARLGKGISVKVTEMPAAKADGEK